MNSDELRRLEAERRQREQNWLASESEKQREFLSRQAANNHTWDLLFWFVFGAAMMALGLAIGTGRQSLPHLRVTRLGMDRLNHSG